MGIVSARLNEVLAVSMRTDVGMVRSNNEDAIFADPGLGLMLLADGMGGYNAGEVASAMAISMIASDVERNFNSGETVVEEISEPMTVVEGETEAVQHSFTQRCLFDAITEANTAIYQAATNKPEYGGMGTTVVCAWFYDNKITVAHAGDSRLYCLRAGEFQQLTRDHSVLQEYLDNGLITPEEAPYFMYRNLVTRALGVDSQIQPEVHEYDASPGDIYLLCSDGLSEMLSDDVIAQTIQTHENDLEVGATRLVDMAVESGGRDNVSLILIRVLRDFAAPQRGWRQLLKSWFT